MQLEELLHVPGLTPAIFYGTYREDRGGLVHIGGLGAHLTFEPGSAVNANYASRELFWPRDFPAPSWRRSSKSGGSGPSSAADPGMDGLSGGDAVIRLGLGGTPTAYTLRATARLANGRAIRTVAAVAKYGVSAQTPWEIVRWYDIAD